MIEIDIERHIDAPPPLVFSILSDHEAMPRWFPAREVVRRRLGAPHPDGVGAVRVVRTLGLAIEERVTAFEPGARLDTELIEGAPFREYRATIRVVPEGAGARVRWAVALCPLVPGTGALMARIVRRLLVRGLGTLARDAESAVRPATAGSAA